MSATPDGGEYSRDWLLRAAEAEDQVSSVSVGGLAADMGWLDAEPTAPAAASGLPAREEAE